AHFVGMGQMAALGTYVSSYGGGLIMAGGEDSYGSGGYQGTRIERIMPVRFDTKLDRHKAVVAVILMIDRSGSMDGAPLEMAKTSARSTTEALDPKDIIGVVAFDSE